MDRRAFIVLLLVVPLLGCSGDPTDSGAGPSSAKPAAEPDFAPVTTHQTLTADGPEVTAPGAVFNLPSGWQQQTPSSSMRLAQALVPGPGGDGELTVFFFGPGGGGGVDSNIQRWVGQVETEAPPVRDVFVNGDYRVTWVEARGILKPSTMGTGPMEPQPGSVLLGAVVEGPGGPWYFKATGPAGTLDSQREAFMAMLRSLRAGA